MDRMDLLRWTFPAVAAAATRFGSNLKIARSAIFFVLKKKPMKKTELLHKLLNVSPNPCDLAFKRVLKNCALRNF